MAEAVDSGGRRAAGAGDAAAPADAPVIEVRGLVKCFGALPVSRFAVGPRPVAPKPRKWCAVLG